MSTDDRYNGWANRETWAVALHINNDQGWQESVLEALREAAETWDDLNVSGGLTGAGEDTIAAGRAAAIVQESVESVLDVEAMRQGRFYVLAEPQWLALQDIGSLWRVDWTELGAAFLSDLDES